MDVLCIINHYIKIMDVSCIMRRIGRKDGPGGRTDRAEGPGGRTGRTDRADGPGGRTGRKDGRTARKDGPGGPGGPGGRKDRAEGRKDPPTPRPTPPTPHPPQKSGKSCFFENMKRCASKFCEGCTERQLQIIDMELFGANSVFENW